MAMFIISILMFGNGVYVIQLSHRSPLHMHDGVGPVKADGDDFEEIFPVSFGKEFIDSCLAQY